MELAHLLRYLCSLMAIDKRNTNFGTTAICFSDAERCKATFRIPQHWNLSQAFTSQPCVEIDKPDRRCLGKLWLVRCSYRFDMYRKAECHCTCEKLVQHSRRLPQVQLGAAWCSYCLTVTMCCRVACRVISCHLLATARLYLMLISGGRPFRCADGWLPSTFYVFHHFSTSWKKSWDLEWCEKGLLGWTANASWSFFEQLLVTISIHIFI